MFRATVSQTALSDGLANQYFANRIYGDVISGDNSFVATLRGLFERRMPKEDRMIFQYSTSSRAASQLDDWPISSIIDPYSWETGKVRLHAFTRTDSDSNAAYLRAADEYYSAAEGWVKLPKPTEYYARTMGVLVFVKADTKNVMIFMDSSDIRKIHFLEAGVLSFFPWYFNPADGFLPSEKALCESLMKSTPDAYYEAIKAIADEINFRDELKKKVLNDFESSYDREKLERMKRDISEVDDKIERLRNEIADYLESRNDKNLAILGLEFKIANGDGGEFGEYFTSNSHLSLLGAEGNTIEFAAKGYLTYWDDDIFNRVWKNRSSYLYRGRAEFTNGDMERLMKAVFVDRIIKIRVCAAFRLHPGRSLERLRRYPYPKDEFGTYMPNTHLDQHGCIGDNENEISRLLEMHDYIGVAEQAIACAVGFNFGDSVVGREFADIICGNDSGTNVKAFELPDGTITDPKGAVKWLNEQESADEEESEE